jgi:hypothetical protein
MDTPLSANQLQAPADRLDRLEKRYRRLVVVCFGVLALILFSLVVFAWWLRHQTKSLRTSILDLEFSQAASQYVKSESLASPDVGVIQFLNNGYSIHFDTVRYTQEGLFLSGRIGNPKELTLSTITINFSVRPYPYSMRGKWEKDKSEFFYPYFGGYEIGSAQTSVSGNLTGGFTLPFSVTIPNVKQTKDSIQIAVAFSGERYNYIDGQW